jgi:hypothetical protein
MSFPPNAYLSEDTPQSREKAVMADGSERLAGRVTIVTGAGSRAGGVTGQHRKARTNRSLLKGEGWNVGNGVLYLVSEEARWVTGIVLPVDAGASAAASTYPARRGDSTAR